MQPTIINATIPFCYKYKERPWDNEQNLNGICEIGWD